MMAADRNINCEAHKRARSRCDFYNRCQVAEQLQRPPQAALTLGEILAAPGLGLKLVAGFETAEGAPVAGAHCIEIERPSRWLAEDWIMLTTGLRLRGHAAAQRELIDELIDAGCCSLGFGLGFAFAEVPRALLRQAQERGFPVFAVPPPTPFRELVSAVQRALISAEIRGEVHARTASRAAAASSQAQSTPGPPESEAQAQGAAASGRAQPAPTREAQALLAPLHARPQLHQTLLAYLDNELDVGASAAALQLHPNTMRYRLRQIEGLLGGSLKSPALLSRVYLALQADQDVGS